MPVHIRLCRPHRRLTTLLGCAAGIGALLIAGCGEPAAATPSSSNSAGTGETPTPTADAQTATPPTPAPADAPPPPPPPPPPAVEQTVDEDQLKTVRKWLDDTESGDAGKTQAALENMKKMGNLAALPLAEIVARDHDHPTRQIAAMDQLESLRFMSNPRALEVVVEALDSANVELKQRAIGVCGRHKIVAAIPKLKAILNDPAQAVLRNNCAQALIELGDEDAMTLAKGQLTSENPVTRARAVYMIRKQGSSKNLDLLQPLAADKDRDVRMEVVEACGDLGGVEAVTVLGKMLDDSDHAIVRDSCKHLKRITGVSISREPEKWKEWLKNEFEKKGAAAFKKGSAAEPPVVAPKPRVHRETRGGVPTPNAPPPEPDGLAPEGDGEGEGALE